MGTPSVVMQSNTPKNLALTQTLGLPDPISYEDENFLDALLNHTDLALETGPVDPEILPALRERALRNFDGLREV